MFTIISKPRNNYVPDRVLYLKELVRQGVLIEVVVTEGDSFKHDRDILDDLGLTMVNIRDRVWFHKNRKFVTKRTSRKFSIFRWNKGLLTRYVSHYYFFDRKEAIMFKLYAD